MFDESDAERRARDLIACLMAHDVASIRPWISESLYEPLSWGQTIAFTRITGGLERIEHVAVERVERGFELRVRVSFARGPAVLELAIDAAGTVCSFTFTPGS